MWIQHGKGLPLCNPHIKSLEVTVLFLPVKSWPDRDVSNSCRSHREVRTRGSLRPRNGETGGWIQAVAAYLAGAETRGETSMASGNLPGDRCRGRNTWTVIGEFLHSVWTIPRENFRRTASESCRHHAVRVTVRSTARFPQYISEKSRLVLLAGGGEYICS